MPRPKYQTLTEQMFYVLLCLKEDMCGMDILDRVPDMTEGRVHVGSGTLYNLLEQFVTMGFIRETSAFGRKRTYRLTQHGAEILEKEYQRILLQAQDYARMMGKEEAE